MAIGNDISRDELHRNFVEAMEHIDQLRKNRDAAITRITELEQENSDLLKSKLSNEAKLRNKQEHIKNQARVIEQLEEKLRILNKNFNRVCSEQKVSHQDIERLEAQVAHWKKKFI